MRTQDLIDRFSGTTPDRCKAIFSSIFILGNRLQTLFDNHIPDLSLKQFMLLSLVRQADRPQTQARLGELLGCSRQNIRKLAAVLERKGFVRVERSSGGDRNLRICPTEKVEEYFRGDFAQYQEELGYLFDVYTEEEISSLFALLCKMYDGVANLREKVDGIPAKEAEGE